MSNKFNETKTFAEGVTKQIIDYLPDQYKSVECTICEVPKNNGIIKVGITFRMPGSNICPTLYMEEYYEQLKNGEDIRNILQDISIVFINSVQEPIHFDIESIYDFETVKEKIIPVLVNGETNRELLKEFPHRKIADLALIYEIEIENVITDFTGSIKIKHKFLTEWGISEKELYQIAANNLMKKKRPALYALNEIANEDIPETDFHNILWNEPKQMQEELLLTTEQLYNGAAFLAIPEVMTRVGKFFPNGCYIIPFSINEVILHPKNEDYICDYIGLIEEMNSYILESKEFLSNNLYEYSPEHGCISIVTE